MICTPKVSNFWGAYHFGSLFVYSGKLLFKLSKNTSYTIEYEDGERQKYDREELGYSKGHTSEQCSAEVDNQELYCCDDTHNGEEDPILQYAEEDECPVASGGEGVGYPCEDKERIEGAEVS